MKILLFLSIFFISSVASLLNAEKVSADKYVFLGKKCIATPSLANSGAKIELKVQTDAMQITKGSITVSLKGKEIRKIEPLPRENEKTYSKSRTYDLGTYTEPGIYKVFVDANGNSKVSTIEGGEGAECTVDRAFTIGDPNSPIKLTTKPQNPITQEIKVLDELQISGLEPGDYFVKLINWNKRDALWNKEKKDKQTIWTVGSDKLLTAKNICNDGGANRTDCTKIFEDKTYTVEVYKQESEFRQSKDPVNTSPLSFEVRVGKNNDKGVKIPPPCDFEEGNKECETALGRIEATPQGFLKTVLSLGIGIAGLIAFILLLYGGFQIVTSQGNAEKVQNGQAIITSAIVGLLFILASVFLLGFIGGNLIGIPQFRNSGGTTTNTKINNSAKQRQTSFQEEISRCQNQPEPIRSLCVEDVQRKYNVSP